MKAWRPDRRSYALPRRALLVFRALFLFWALFVAAQPEEFSVRPAFVMSALGGYLAFEAILGLGHQGKKIYVCLIGLSLLLVSAGMIARAL